MINKFFLVVKKFILSTLFIYAYDSIVFYDHTIAINIFNVIVVSYFDFFGMIYLILFSFI